MEHDLAGGRLVVIGGPMYGLPLLSKMRVGLKNQNLL